MISHLFRVMYGLPENAILGFDNFHNMNRDIPRIFFTHDNYIKDFTGDFDSKQPFYTACTLSLHGVQDHLERYAALATSMAAACAPGEVAEKDNLERIAARCRKLKSDKPETLAEAIQLIFAPGFSTKAIASQISGRGVGMDAVRRAVEQLKGDVRVRARPERP